MESSASPDVQHRPLSPVGNIGQERCHQPEPVESVVLDFVSSGVIPDVWAADGALGHLAQWGQILTKPLGVRNCAALMPGAPFGATHSTLTSSSGCSTL